MRNKTIHTLLALAALSLCPSSHAAESGEDAAAFSAHSGSGDWKGSVVFWSPNDDEQWKAARGIRLQYTYWYEPDWGAAFGIGAETWDAKEEISVEAGDLPDGFSYGYAWRQKGSATVIPLSASLIWRHVFDPCWSIRVESGLAYLIVNSQIEFEEGVAIGANGEVLEVEEFRSEVDIQSSLMWTGGLDVHYRMQSMPEYSFFAGIGGRLSLSAGTTHVEGSPVRPGFTYDTDFDGFGLRLGMTAVF
jgi:hypothetical protein